MQPITTSLVCLVAVMQASGHISAQVISGPCPGCTDLSMPPTDPPAHTFSGSNPLPAGPPTIDVATVDVDVVFLNQSGICSIQNAVPFPGDPFYVCAEVLPCRPRVYIQLTLIRDLADVFGGTITFGISAGGTICNVGHSGVPASSGPLPWPGLELFNDDVKVECKSMCAVSTSYDISCTWWPTPLGPAQSYGSVTIPLNGTLICSACEPLVY